MKQAHADLGAAASPVELLACSAALDHATLPPLVPTSSAAPASPLTRALVISLGLLGECAALMLGIPGGDGARCSDGPAGRRHRGVAWHRRRERRGVGQRG